MARGLHKLHTHPTDATKHYSNPCHSGSQYTPHSCTPCITQRARLAEVQDIQDASSRVVVVR